MTELNFSTTGNTSQQIEQSPPSDCFLASCSGRPAERICGTCDHVSPGCPHGRGGSRIRPYGGETES
jgi:hypothetical protein